MTTITKESRLLNVESVSNTIKLVGTATITLNQIENVNGQVLINDAYEGNFYVNQENTNISVKDNANMVKVSEALAIMLNDIKLL